jgi:hypothetical protein
MPERLSVAEFVSGARVYPPKRTLFDTNFEARF